MGNIKNDLMDIFEDILPGESIRGKWFTKMSYVDNMER